MAHARARSGELVHVALVQPHAVAERQARAEQAELLDVVHRRPAAAPEGVLLLVGGLEEVHVERRVVALGRLSQSLERRVRTPVQVRRGELDAGAGLVVVFGMKVAEHRHVVVEPGLEGLEDALHRVLQLGRQTRDELRVGLIDEAVLVAHGVAVGDAHPDVVVGAQHLFGARTHLVQRSGQPAVDVLDRGDPGLDHLERRVERVEVEVDGAASRGG